MGIPLLLTWLKRRFASCFLPSSSCPAADCLYVDVNGLVYQAAALATANEAAATDVDAAILQKLFDLLDDIVFRLVRPQSLVYLAVDGISPMGKLAQQRSRRRRQRRQQQRGGGLRGCNAVEWDSNNISVGTPFMSRLTDALHFYCASRAERINVERLRNELQRVEQEKKEEDKTTVAKHITTPISFVVDDVWRPGEGENKIADAIRRFRSQPTYDPNTSHIICSSDTDVTVCSLILHEPRMFVLRYEYPVGSSTTTSSEGNRSWRNHVGDNWTSTFFSIYAFREHLRAKLRLQLSENDSADEVERKNRQFERTLHDVVFVLLLFGNDFLPSVGCRIEEGFLDDLLELLATDFISRNRFIIDPITNTIQFDAARYALDSLAEMQNERNDGNSLSVDNGADGAGDWGFADEAFLRRKQAMEEAELAPQCYAYWTMLQWSLQNSAGVVEHWGCYYPYPTAPPLHLLRKYCGTLSYDALIELAKKRSHKKHSNNTVKSLSDAEVTAKVWSNGPADVLVQLLVLLPARSVTLLPSAVRNAYSEIEPIVLAPVEQLDFPAIEAWCEKKWIMFTEEERGRFQAYALAAGQKVLAKEAQGAPIQGNEMVFVADWDAEWFASEVKHAKTVKDLKAAELTLRVDNKKRGATLSLATNTTCASAFSLFGMRSSHKPSAAVAALMNASKESNVSACDNIRDDQNSISSCNSDSVVGAPLVIVQETYNSKEQAEVLCGRGFTLITAPIDILGDVAMIKNVGSVVGDTFVCGRFTSPPLSRHRQKMRVRLRWRVASKPLLTSVTFVPDLLPGYTVSPLLLSPCHTTKRPGVKRSISNVNHSESDSDEENKDAKGVSSNCDVMTELEKKKEAVRSRLEALQARASETK